MKPNLRYPALPSVPDGATDDRLDAPAFHRNAEPILDALTPHLARSTGALFEIGSGSGQHAALLAQAFPSLTYWPSDPNPLHRASIDAWATRLGAATLQPAIDFDATATDWRRAAGGPTIKIQAILSINVIHIAPWAVAEGLFRGAAQRLANDGVLALYGPFRFHGTHIAESNAAFDQSLRWENPDWGVRDIDDIKALAEVNGVVHAETTALPSNNHMLVFTR